MQETIYQLWEYFHLKVKSESRYLPRSTRNAKIVKNFLKKLDKAGIKIIGYNYLFDYFCHQWHYWSSSNTKREITLEWIIGKKAVDRWLNDRREDYQFIYSEQLVKPFKINKLALILDAGEPGVYPDEELYKKRFEGETQLYYCMEFTTMYNHRSAMCRLCSVKAQCKAKLKEVDFRTFKTRGYE